MLINITLGRISRIDMPRLRSIHHVFEQMIWSSLGAPFTVTQYSYSAYNIKIRNYDTFETGRWCVLTFSQCQLQLQSCSARHLQKSIKAWEYCNCSV